MCVGRAARDGRAPVAWAAGRAAVGERPLCVGTAVVIKVCGMDARWGAARV